MFILKDASIVNATMGLAQKHLDMTALPGEREMRDSRLKELDNEIEGGTFSNPIWSIALLKGTDRRFRADGQHTATAMVQAGNKFPVGCKVLIVTYEIDNLKEDAPALFLRLDDSDAVRNQTATMNSLAVTYRDFHDIKPAFIVTAVAGIVYHLKELNAQQKDPSQRIKIRKAKFRGYYLADRNYRNFILFLNHWNNLTDDSGQPRKAANAWLMHKPPVVAEAMTNFFAHTEAAKVFWDYMLDDAGPKGHPTKELVGRFNDWRSRLDPPKPDKWRNAIRPVWKQFLTDYENGKVKKAS